MLSFHSHNLWSRFYYYYLILHMKILCDQDLNHQVPLSKLRLEGWVIKKVVWYVCVCSREREGDRRKNKTKIWKIKGITCSFSLRSVTREHVINLKYFQVISQTKIPDINKKKKNESRFLLHFTSFILPILTQTSTSLSCTHTYTNTNTYTTRFNLEN